MLAIFVYIYSVLVLLLFLANISEGYFCLVCVKNRKSKTRGVNSYTFCNMLNKVFVFADNIREVALFFCLFLYF